MILFQRDLAALEGHWAVGSIAQSDRVRAHEIANSRLVADALGSVLALEEFSDARDEGLLQRVSAAYEIAAVEGLDALTAPLRDHEGVAIQARAGAFRAFELRRVMPIPSEPLGRVFHVLHLAALAYAGDRWADLRRWLFDHADEVQAPNVANVAWDQRVLYRVYDGWLRLFRKDSWNDLHAISEIVAGLRSEQNQYESSLIGGEDPGENSARALQLVALYHLARSTEQLAGYMLQGQPAGISSVLDFHFEKSVAAAHGAGDLNLELLLRWLHVASRRMAAGSLWAATAGINSRVSRFVRRVTSSAQPMIELLPPQRAALAEQGLLDPASRAIVVDLPTSGGKTALAQFRILQALNQFSQDGGWVAYVAPTRALVAQLTRRLRRDFSPLGVKVEQLTGGLEIDSFEDQLLSEAQAFDVLISTPEKLSLVIRNGKLSHRPLALVVLDEAQNIEDEERGLRIELLLATIRQDCPTANYLLMMPFVPDADLLARWLDPEAGRPISLGTTAWQPNERVVGLYSISELAERGEKNRKLWSLNFETVTTTPNTIHLRGVHRAGDVCPLSIPINQARSLMSMTVAMAKTFSARGVSIAVGDTIPHVWKMAQDAAASMQGPAKLPREVKLVQEFLRAEVGESFELASLLQKQVAVHHAGLPDEARTLVEWLAEEGHLRVLCATTTIAQGINFPVSSVFLSRTEHPTQRGPVPMSPREFWNLAGRAGRVGQDTVGVVGIATASEEKTSSLKEFLMRATTSLASRLVGMLDAISKLPQDQQLTTVIHDPQWADFRSFVAHLLREANSLQSLQSQADTLLRNTFGYTTLRSDLSGEARAHAANLLSLTNAYAQRIAQNMGSLTLVDATGFDPEGVRIAMASLWGLDKKLTERDWEPKSMFGDSQSLSQLIGVMMRVPSLNQALEDIAGNGRDRKRVADIAKAWVGGESFAEIAAKYFDGETSTQKITEACKGIYRALLNNGVWGLSALSKLPGSGLNWDEMPEDQRRQLNLLPAYLYHGVDSAEAVLMRMNQVPRSMAKKLGRAFRREHGDIHSSVSSARDFLRSLPPEGWENVKPRNSRLSGDQYMEVWQRLSGEVH